MISLKNTFTKAHCFGHYFMPDFIANLKLGVLILLGLRNHNYTENNLKLIRFLQT